jgi:hypothetical protein
MTSSRCLGPCPTHTRRETFERRPHSRRTAGVHVETQAKIRQGLGGSRWRRHDRAGASRIIAPGPAPARLLLIGCWASRHRLCVTSHTQTSRRDDTERMGDHRSGEPHVASTSQAVAFETTSSRYSRGRLRNVRRQSAAHPAVGGSAGSSHRVLFSNPDRSVATARGV